MKNLENEVIEYFKKFSVEARKIAESDEKTPDFLIEQEEVVLIELKEKSDDEALHQREQKELAEGGVFEHVGTTGYRNRISGVIGNGIKQLKAQKENTKSDFCLLFIVANGVAQGTQAEQIISTLYGRKHIIDFESQSSEASSCYYAYHSEFFKHRNIIDGVFLITNRNVVLLVNDKSPNYTEFKASFFLSKFVGKIGIFDLVDLEAKENIMVADCDIPRSNEEAVKQYIFDKYSIERGMMLDFPHYSFKAQVNENEI
ncbi:TPA: hypothetical protein RQJ98_004576 [Vibrio vulnificus]|uniref:hypothetical protein n=1 Tax=Vibrio vulnificus TaxID=672 RepID=UPI0005F2517C|nr:hypothetical protein [Vibrio vulnificus]MCG6312928.1 hypothetical protein [Vibrio vulnificus]HAS6364255.1 hypothetical protein [Vibrio vulnificus]HDY7544900.1 hypothetical protein [Vibrio vulnificus]HDY7685920.1 hypothetical protein [Vibrio vulnificus]